MIKFSLNSLVPSSDILRTDGYFRYIGSLTTPPCTEGVKWTVFRAKINISQAQVFLNSCFCLKNLVYLFLKKMEQFYKNEIDFNNREIQELNSRELFTNVKLDYSDTQKINVFSKILKFINNLIRNFYELIKK